MSYFVINPDELDLLSKQDPILGEAIQAIGLVQRTVNPDLFSALITSIVGQQISIKAAVTVNNRLQQLLGDVTLHKIIEVSTEDIQQCGMSFRKAENIKQIGELFLSQEYDVEVLKTLDDACFIQEMIKIKGIGSWTAEMLLIHSLQRKDIISDKDLGILRGMKILYGLDTITKKEFDIFKERYSPYGTLASIYLWEISSQ
jgi:DNA-3-methyladenine glycosylase II